MRYICVAGHLKGGVVIVPCLVAGWASEDNMVAPTAVILEISTTGGIVIVPTGSKIHLERGMLRELHHGLLDLVWLG